jgi:hypothetical protein
MFMIAPLEMQAHVCDGMKFIRVERSSDDDDELDFSMKYLFFVSP